jgi:hypothetical protein
MVGGALLEVEGLLSELEAAGVFSRTEDQIIFSRRMVQDEKVRETRASGGIQSLNHPNVQQPKNSRKDTIEGSVRVSLPPSFGGSPSSSSSSSKTSSSELQTSSDKVSPPAKKNAPRQPSQEACRLAALLKSEILKNKPDYSITGRQERNWVATAQRMLTRDNRCPEQIEKVIRWVQKDDFWMPNMLSMDTLREKFDQLELKMNRDRPQFAAAATKLPATYVPASEKILQERRAGGLQ